MLIITRNWHRLIYKKKNFIYNSFYSDKKCKDKGIIKRHIMVIIKLNNNQNVHDVRICKCNVIMIIIQYNFQVGGGGK